MKKTIKMQGECEKKKKIQTKDDLNVPLNLKCPGIKYKRKEKNRVFPSSHPSLVAPVSEVAEVKYFCPLLI